MTHKSDIQQARTALTAVRAYPRRFGRAALGALALSLIAFASPALAGPPSHPRDEARDIAGFDHACGTAVDSEGDVYVSSAGESKVRIFDLEHTELTFIENSNEPCSLAVDSRGTLIVSEQGTGNVVRYVPSEYPFTGPPTYGPPEAIDESGEAKSIAIDAGTLTTNSDFVIGGDDSLYIARNDHIDAYRNETQGIRVNATGGTYTLSFNGSAPTPALPAGASHKDVQEALEALSPIGPGNVSVTTANWQATDHLITFIHELGLADVPPIEVDATNLTGGGVTMSETNGGLAASIGATNLTDATGVAAYTYRVGSGKFDRYVFAADAATDQVKVFGGPDIRTLKLRRTIESVDHDGNPETADQKLGFGAAGAYLAVDPGNANPVTQKCEEPVVEQACTAGHLLVYDSGHQAVDEFEASGEFLDQFTDEALADAEPTGLAVDRSGGSGDGTIYVSSGNGEGAKLLAFAPLVSPGRLLLPEPLTHRLEFAQAVSTDSYGNVYVAAGRTVYIYSPDPPSGLEPNGGPEPLTTFIDSNLGGNKDLAVDSDGNVYVLEDGEQVTYYTPIGGYPPVSGTKYERHEPPVATLDSFPSRTEFTNISAIGLNPANDRLFVTSSSPGQIIELKSAAEGSAIADPDFGNESGTLGTLLEVDVYGANGNVYASQNGAPAAPVLVIGPGEEGIPDDEEVIARITGAGCPQGPLPPNPRIAVDQSNGHVLAFAINTFSEDPAVITEYDASGACVAQFGAVPRVGKLESRLVVDNGASSPNVGNVYLAREGADRSTPTLHAFGPLEYGGPPETMTGFATDVGGGKATLNGTVDPRGFELEACRFEYTTEADFQENSFGGVLTEAELCAESPEEIGSGEGPVPVHADLTGLDPEERYRYRLVAENRFGPSPTEAKVGLFGPPRLETEAALPVLYDEASLRAQIDPSGLVTTYRFEYGRSEAYGQSTPTSELRPGDGFVAVQGPLTGLGEATTYHFRVVVENEAKTVPGPDQTFTTLQRAEPQDCPNAEYRTGLSANLPDCRAYELVTPAETRGVQPDSVFFGTAERLANNWLVAPRGAGAGESVAFVTFRTLPGFDGNGQQDGYRSQRANGPHPSAGWMTHLFGPTFAQSPESPPTSMGIASDQLYWLWRINATAGAAGGVLPASEYLRTPTGIEPLGQGGLGTDPDAEGRFLSTGGVHVLYSSAAHLEPAAAPVGTEALYDRAAGASSAEVVSVKPDGSPFDAGEDATYISATEDGSAVAFKVGGVLYLHREGTTTKVAAAPNTFAGISEDGQRLFYADMTFSEAGAVPAGLFACDVEAGPCAGPEAHAPTEIAPNSIFVNVSPDGSVVYFTSTDVLDEAEEGVLGEDNLYLWDATTETTRFVSVLDPADFEGEVNLGAWTTAIGYGLNAGRAKSPTRATPDGSVLVFESRAQLTPYDNTEASEGACGSANSAGEPCVEIYRYDSEAAPAGVTSCVSCDPSGTPPDADARLHTVTSTGDPPVADTTLITNITDDGRTVFFHSDDRLLPEDANVVQDVYEWKVQRTGDCQRPGGCLALISSGQGEDDSILFGMSADGHDVFFFTKEKLVRADVSGSPSVYDARVEGGIPDPPEKAPCQGDVCQGTGTIPPVLPNPPSARLGEGGNTSGEEGKRKRCARGKRRVKRKAEIHCVKRRHRSKQHRANANRRAQR